MVNVLSKINKIYFINLASRTDRKKLFLNEIKKSKYIDNIVDRREAINGKNINLSTISNKFITEEGRNKILSNEVNQKHIDLNYGALGCALSHASLYEECIDEQYNSIFIFEDDITIDAKFDSFIEQALLLDFNSFDILYFGYHDQIAKEPLTSEFDKVTSRVFGLFGYMITNRGAKNLIKTVFPISKQIDTAIGYNIRKKNITALCTKHRVVICLKQFSSDIQGINGLKPDIKNDDLLDIFCNNTTTKK
jgi:GR25 family glycosyltransferase involved in LPS biosynthesis